MGSRDGLRLRFSRVGYDYDFLGRAGQAGRQGWLIWRMDHDWMYGYGYGVVLQDGFRFQRLVLMRVF